MVAALKLSKAVLTVYVLRKEAALDNNSSTGSLAAVMIFLVVLITAPTAVVGFVSSFLEFVIGPTTEQTTHKAHPRTEKPKPAGPSAEPGSTGGGDGTPTYVYGIIGVSVLGLSGGTSYIFFRVKRRRKRTDADADDGRANQLDGIEQRLAASPTHAELQEMLKIVGAMDDSQAKNTTIGRIREAMSTEREIAADGALKGVNARLDELFVERGRVREYPTDEE